MSAAEWITQRRELLDAATEGPWFQGREDHRYESAHEVYSKRDPDEEDSHDIATYVWSAEDAALMVDARTSLPCALDALDAALSTAARGAIGARARGDSDEERRWLDLQIVIDSALKGTP